MLPIFVLFSFKINNFVNLQFATSSILVMYMQFFYLISIIYNFHMYRYFAKQKSCILKLFYINTVYNLHSNYIFRLLIRWWWWLITSAYPSSPKSFMRPLMRERGGGGVVPGIFNLFNKAFIQIKLDFLTLLPHPLYRFTDNFVSSWEIFPGIARFAGSMLYICESSLISLRMKRILT